MDLCPLCWSAGKISKSFTNNKTEFTTEYFKESTTVQQLSTMDKHILL